jgi:poly-gamma-glutamate synthesis protein (capsule biosynthesis protein)
MKETYRFFADAGASAIVNHHQHCFSGYEVYNGIPVFYGLGNFCFDNSGYRNATWNEGYMVQLFFDDDDLSFELHPYRQCDENPNIRLLDEIEKKTFDRRIKQLNEIIADDAQLSHCFADLANSRRNYFMSAFQPYYHRVFRKLGFLHLISKFASKRRLLKIQNFVCCESHHDILQFIFKIK